jgi:hypothetical protein
VKTARRFDSRAPRRHGRIYRPQSRCALTSGSITSFALVVWLGACGSDSPPHSSAPGSGGKGGGTGGTGGSISGGSGGSAGSGGSVSGGSGGAAAGGSGGAAAGGSGGAAAGGSGGDDGGVSGSAGAGATGGMGQASYYVSPTGSDANAGTESAPFLTISKARDVVRAIAANMTGDIHVYLRGGTYGIGSTIAFGPEDSGTNGHRIIYQGYPGETPILSGATKVTGWTQHNGSIFKATLNRTTKLRNLYVNDSRALMASKTVTARGGYGTYSVNAGQASWAWVSGSKSDGVKYNTADVPAIASNKDDLEIVNGTTWNENIACVRDVETTADNFRGLLLQQPYGAIAQLPGWDAGFSGTGTHTLFNAFEFLNSPGQFYFDKTTRTLYYYARPGESMTTADVQAPVVEKLIDIAGTSTTNRVKNLTFQGITFAYTDYNLHNVGNSRGKASVQAATVYIAFGNGDWHASKYEITDTLPGVINVNNADSIDFTGNTIKHGGSDGLSLTNDVVNSNVTGNYITDITCSGVTIGHPQHIYSGDTGAHAKFAGGVEGISTSSTIANNVIYDVSFVRGFGGCSGITAFFVNSLTIKNNHIQKTAYNGISMGWGWRNFPDSTTCKNNTINNNRLVNTMARLHDSGAI